jgi:DNA-binding NarL/FixJ family response regulator
VRKRPSSRPPSLLIADDNPQVLELVAGILKEEFDIIATARDGADALAAAVRLRPDAVVIDLSLPGMSGLEFAIEWRSVNPRARVILVTVYEDIPLLQTALGHGVLGYIHKNQLQTDLVPALRAALKGQIFVTPRLRII